MIFFPFMMVYLEYYFHSALYDNIDLNFLFVVLFGIAFGMLAAVITMFFKSKGNVVVTYAMTILITIIYIAQVLYYRIFNTFFGIASIKGAGDALAFKNELWRAAKSCAVYIIWFLLPLVILIILHICKIAFVRPSYKQTLICVGSVIVMFVVAVLSLNLGGKNAFSPYRLYHDTYIMEVSMKKLGLAVTSVRDICNFVTDETASVPEMEFNENYEDVITTTKDGYEPQIDKSIDLKSLYVSTDDAVIKNITAYISNKEPTYKNEYTGMFEGYNLVFISAESLCPYVIREEWMPTLYQMMNEGFVFHNFYNPTWYRSTIDGEFVNCLSQYPSSVVWSMYESSDTYQPYALGNALNEEGYTSIAYHDYDYFYYDRSKTHPNMGYEFKAIGDGLILENEDTLQYSDYEMMQVACEEAIVNEPFNLYFMTYSGHLPYEFSGGNDISDKNREEAEQLAGELYDNEEVLSYIAAQLEFEKAMKYFVEKLEEENKLDHTLFVIAPDHYPCALSGEKQYNMLAGENVLDDTFEKEHSCLIIWSASMENPIEVDKICSSLDILPTVLNLMGIEYDSRLLAGKDILSTSEGRVLYSNHSFMNDYFKYDAEECTVYNQDSSYDADKVYEVLDENEEEINISYEIINQDYFRYIYEHK